ncbi:hypothetical protein CIT292_07532 [Citrobacter youngae ATCC 29220]|uniref:Uncharacterized protein n=1 Tax=Citrobacter youngae ATCC 29220 TaxID=500640 RepID=D4BAN8_9ENTR|nr:hypothetical protein CIT292_07532 [Citrobacter youngae ATCC 29220]
MITLENRHTFLRRIIFFANSLRHNPFPRRLLNDNASLSSI